MERPTRKRKGLYIKNDNEILDTIVLRKFSFEEICDLELITHDNPSGSLIYQKYHNKDHIDKALYRHPGLKAEIRDEDSIPPILQPIDFTADWRRQQERASKRVRGRLDEDDEFELELEMARRKQLQDMDTATDGVQQEEVYGPPVQPTDGFAEERDNLTTVGEAIMSLNENVHEDDVQTEATSEANNPSTEKADQPPLAQQAVPDSTRSDDSTQASEDFRPVPTQDSPHPEKDAMKQFALEKEQQKEAVQQAFDQAKSEGYEDGFKEGEAKGVAKLNDLTQKITGNVSELLAELGQLKRNILASAEENFIQVSQAIAESLIEREFSIHPEAFARIIRKAIADNMHEDRFSVRVHPAFAEHLQKIDLGELKELLQADESIEPGSFKIESQLSTVEGNLKQVIADLLEAAEDEIFVTEEEAG